MTASAATHMTSNNAALHNRFSNSADSSQAMTDSMRQALHSSTWLKQELQDPVLRDFIARIATTSNHVTNKGWTRQEQVYEDMRESNPALRQFIDQLLVLTRVLMPQDIKNDTEASTSQSVLDDWLVQSSKQAPADFYGQHVLLQSLPGGRQARVDLSVDDNEFGRLQNDNVDSEASSGTSDDSSDGESNSTSSDSSSSDSSSDDEEGEEGEIA
jgi:hypothetical protein